MDNQQNKLVVFQSKNIRRIWHEKEWFYSVVDIIEALTNSPTPRQYWGKVKDREFARLQLSPIWVQLKLLSKDGKNYKTDCVNTKSAFRLIQSIPSKKADTFGENKNVAKRGGKVAGNARKETEKELGRSIISDNNFLDSDYKLKLDE